MRLRPSRLALLAAIAAAGARGVSRERLAGLFWPEADDQRAIHSLRQARYALRSELDREVIRAEWPMLWLDSTAITSDVADFHAALAQGDEQRAVSLARRPFLDGFYLGASGGGAAGEFERWVEEERARLTTATTSALLSLANAGSRTGDLDEAVRWWRELTVRDPLNGRFAIGYVKALAARGDRVAALAFVRQHTAVVRRELEAEPDPEVVGLEDELRAMPSPPPSRRTPARVEPVAAPTEPLTTLEEPGSAETVADTPVGRRHGARRGLLGLGAAAALVLTVSAAVARQRGWFSHDTQPVFAVGLIREDGLPDTQRVGGVLTDMLATNLARVQGLTVLANSRVLEMVKPDRDSAAAYADAARRAGASELLEGRVTTLPRGAIQLEMRRVELKTGIVREVYRARAADRYALVDSVTQVVAHRFRLISPGGSVAAATTASPMAYRLYEEGLRALFSGDQPAAQRLMRAALDEDSMFTMAAYYEAMIGWGNSERFPDGRYVGDAQLKALQLARHAAEGQRLMISANLLNWRQEPEALAMAESLAARYPDDPRALATLGKARWTSGDWAGSAQAIERAVKLDSATDSKDSPVCHLCDDYAALAETYMWWDSLPAAAAAERRLLKARPSTGWPWHQLAAVSARLGDSAASYAALRQGVELGGGDRSHSRVRIDLTLGAYEAVEQEVRPLLASSAAEEWADGANSLLLALRNEGRLRDAFELHETGWLPGFPAVPRNPNDFDRGILLLERGDARAAAAVFHEKARRLGSHWSNGLQARARTWNTTLEGMSLAAAGDTSAVRALVDTVEEWGRRSAYGRDRKSHHYLRGLMFVAQHRDEDAVNSFRAAIHSPNLGFTRVNYELARALLRLGRPADAVTTLQSSLRGEVDASNLYITRTDLHELLADAFDAAGQRDSAAAHYRAVVKAWRRADDRYYARRERAVVWLARYARGARTAH